jgi:hypothetical protein
VAEMNSEAGSGYAHIFRAIGQSVSKLDPLCFDLELVGDEYIVSGVSKKRLNLAEIKTESGNNLSTGFSNLRFTQSGIDLINGTGKQLRAGNDVSRMDPHSIPNVLRTIGAYLDARGFRFLRLSSDNGTFTVWHINNLQVQTKEMFTPTNIYDLWVRYFKKRDPRHT